MPNLNIKVRISHPKLVRPFIISTGARTHQPVLSVTISDGRVIGRGQATGVRYLGETVESMAQQIEEMPDSAILSRASLSDYLPAGGAMAAVDAALWELEAAQKSTTVAELIGVKPGPIASAFTIVLDTPETMAAQAADESWRPLLKVKLGGSEGDEAERIKAVRRSAPDARLVIDANAGWTPSQLVNLSAIAKDNDYELIEQPLPAGAETTPDAGNALKAASEIIPLCADESLQTLSDLDGVAGLYRYVNIKLDKCGGLTQALAIAEAARAKGLGIFVGCMVAPTIAIAPAHLLSQSADYADLDGPFWLPEEPVSLNEAGHFRPISPLIWGQGLKTDA